MRHVAAPFIEATKVCGDAGPWSAIKRSGSYSAEAPSLKDAVVRFGGGCTGEMISSDGLVLTNHHCGYSSIQRHSSLEHDYLTDGFWAMSRDKELPNPGLTVTFIDKIDDVTDYVRTELKKITDPNSMEFLSAKYLNGLAKAKVGEKFLQDNPGTEVEIKAFYGGNKYYMFTKKVYSDVRLVGAPPSSIGKFGADTDNWMWPRIPETSLFSVCMPTRTEIRHLIRKPMSRFVRNVG